MRNNEFLLCLFHPTIYDISPQKSINHTGSPSISGNRKNFNEANPSHDYICKFSQIVIQRLDLNPKEEVMALFLSAARTGTGYTRCQLSKQN